MGCLKLSYHEGEGSEEKSPLKIFCGLGEKNDSPIFCVDYSPFGLTFNSYQRSYSKANNYKYQGKEEVPEMGGGTYDFHARMYDATLARTFQMDPLADNFLDVSPYSWVMNNPLNNIDPTGMSSVTLRGDDAADAWSSIKNINGWGSGSSGNSESSSGGCGENGEPCPDGEGQANNLMPEGAVSYKDVVPSGGQSSSTTGQANNTGNHSDNSLLESVAKGGSYAGYGSGLLGMGQIGMFAYRQSISLNSKVGTFGRFSTTYSGVGTASRTLGKAGTYVGAPLAVYMDYNAMQSGQITGKRFAYRTVGTGSSVIGGIIIGSSVGGPWGAAGGALIGATFVAGEIVYDAGVRLLDETNRQIYNIKQGLKSGWYPGR